MLTETGEWGGGTAGAGATAAAAAAAAASSAALASEMMPGARVRWWCGGEGEYFKGWVGWEAAGISESSVVEDETGVPGIVTGREVGRAEASTRKSSAMRVQPAVMLRGG